MNNIEPQLNVNISFMNVNLIFIYISGLFSGHSLPLRRPTASGSIAASFRPRGRKLSGCRLSFR
jgi:hypothetical protein